MYAKPKVSAAQRLLNLQEATSALDEVRDSVAFYGMTLEVKGPNPANPAEVREWWFLGEDGLIYFQYWLTTKSSLASRIRTYKVLSGPEEAMELAIDNYLKKGSLNEQA